MALTDRTARRCLPVRLCDLRLEARTAAALRVAKAEPEFAADVLGAALAPSSTTYWVDATAAPILRRLAA